MKALTKKFLGQEITRREFAQGIAALGLSASAVESVVAAVAGSATHAADSGADFAGTGGDILAECLLAAGAEYVFDTNSTGQATFYDALISRPELKMIVALQEGQAVSMAHGYELASSRPGFLVLPGIGMPNSMSNVYNAWKDRSSLVIISDGSDTSLIGRDGFQQADGWMEMTAPFTKWQWEVDRPQRIPEMVRRGIKLATTPAGGPAYVRIPRNIMGASGVDARIYPQSAYAVDINMEPAAEQIEQAAKALVEAEFPLINVGGEVTRAGANETVIELAELLSSPVTQGFSVYGDFPFRHPLFAGFYGMGFPRGLSKVDAFLNLGSLMPDPAIITAPVPKKATVIDARIEYDKIANAYPTDIPIAAGIGETSAALLEAVKDMSSRSQRRKWREVRLERARKSQEAADERNQRRANRGWDSAPIYAERLCYELEQWLDENATVVVETGDRSPQKWIDFGPGRKSLIGPTTGFALGWGVGAALGVRIARPDTQVLALVGDGAMLFGQIESLWTASRYDIPVTVIVFNNRSYDSERGRIHFASQVAKADKSMWKDMSCYLGNPDTNFVSIAQGFGIEGAVLNEPGEIRAVLDRARAVNREGRPFMIDAAIARRGPARESTWHPDISIGRS